MPPSIETRASWTAAFAVLAVMAITYGAPLVMVVGLKSIAEDLGVPRSAAALASSLAWLGTGIGGIPMGWLAERIGLRRVAVFGALSVAFGMWLSTWGGLWALYLGHGLFIGLLGNGAFNAPLMTYTTRWFDRRRGTALALIMSGQYIAGVAWPAIFERTIESSGWHGAMLLFAAAELALALPVIIIFFTRPPEHPTGPAAAGSPLPGGRPLGLPANLVNVLLAVAIFLCCIPMALPNAHLVSFCTDIGISQAHGAAMLSVLTGCAFLSRQFWGWVADRIGGLRSVLAGSLCQVAALACFLATQDETGLFIVAAAFGLGFSGIVPGYILAVRELFPAREAGWRVPIVSFGGLGGMAAGAWIGGLLYDASGTYAAAFHAGIASNLVNIALVGFLILRQFGPRTLFARAAHP
jgi:MFS family permease